MDSLPVRSQRHVSPWVKQSFSCQHKSHITKVMGHGTVGFCFDNDPEQGGAGYLIGLHRCQSFRVMQKQVREQTIDAVTGKRKSKGNAIKSHRGDLVLTDCNVTGSNYGTASKPKFPLMELWTSVLLPELDALVKVRIIRVRLISTVVFIGLECSEA